MDDTREFDESFEKFIESREYEVSRNVLFTTVRLAFMAGWEAAGGEPPPTRPVVVLVTDKPNR
jgi:hypothetical protein